MKKAFQKVMVLILAVSLLCNFSLSVQAATGTTTNWLNLKCALKKHISYDANHKRKLDLGDLK